jgi:hypothetical protein
MASEDCFGGDCVSHAWMPTATAFRPARLQRQQPRHRPAPEVGDGLDGDCDSEIDEVTYGMTATKMAMRTPGL